MLCFHEPDVCQVFKGPFSPLMHCAPWYFDPGFRVTRNYRIFRIFRSKLASLVPKAILGIFFTLSLVVIVYISESIL